MKAGRNEPKDPPSLSPFPEGWYFITGRKTIEKKKLIQQTWMGEQIVVWCDEEGRICVAEDLCPHLGSELGPDDDARLTFGTKGARLRVNPVAGIVGERRGWNTRPESAEKSIALEDAWIVY